MYALDRQCQPVYVLVMEKGRKIFARISEALHSDLKQIAAERVFEGKLSRVVRLALEEFRDRRHRPRKSPVRDDRDQSL